MTTPFTPNAYITSAFSNGNISTAHVIKAALVTTTTPADFDTVASFDFTTHPSLSTVTLSLTNTAGVDDAYITCDPFTFSAVSAIASIGTIIVYDDNGATKRILGSINTGAITSLAAGESITITFPTVDLITDTMFKLAKV